MKTLSKLLGLSFIFFSLGSFAQTAKEVRKEVDKMETQTLEHGAVPAKCGEFLAEYVKNVDELLALSQRKAKEGDTQEIKTKMKAASNRLDELSDKMKENVEVFMDTDCTNAWVNSQQKYTAYIQQNMQNFVPKE